MSCEPEIIKLETARTEKITHLDLPAGIPPLASLYMYIAGSCNLACRHCWIEPDYNPDPASGKFLKVEYAQKAIIESIPLGLRSVKLTGGEPLLHPRIRELLEWINDKELDIYIETNGTLIDSEMARLLQSKKHMRFISVSLDGATATTHEALRAVAGSFEKALQGIKNLVTAGFKPQIICTLHQGNISEIEALVALAEEMSCGSVKFNVVQAMGRGDDFSDSQKLDIDEIIHYFNKIEKGKTEHCSIPIYFDIPPAFRPIRYFLNSPNTHCNVMNIIGILAGGEISLCGIGVSVPELIYGHIASQDMKSIWLEAPGLKKLREAIPDHFQGVCSECIHHWNCLGSCIAQNYHTSKTINASYNFCSEAKNRKLFPENRLKGGIHAKKTSL